MALENDLAQLVARTGTILTRQNDWADGQVALIAGSADDPDSFDRDGLKVGPLGYYPIQNVNGQTIYIPCIDRVQRDLTVGVDVAQVPYTPAIAASPATAGAFLNNQSLRAYPLGSLAAARLSQVPIVVDRIQTAFHTSATVGGGATYRRLGAAPVQPSWYPLSDGTLPGYFQSADGAWWMLTERSVTPEMFGAIGNGDAANVVADTRGLQGALNFSSVTSVPVHCPAATYIVDGYKGDRVGWAAGEWAHGGIIVREGSVLIGAGWGKTIIRNGVNNWRCVLRVRKGRTLIRHLTVDGDVQHHPPMTYDTSIPTSATNGSVRGECIIFEGGDTAGLDIDVYGLEIMNSGHYGIGVQNIGVRTATIDTIIFSRCGGDCIDIKWYPTLDKNLTIQNIWADGCGYYFLTSGVGSDDDSTANTNQAVVDIGGKTLVRNVHISALDSDPTSYGNCGVRLRAKVNASDRLDARGSSVDGVYCYSIKPDGTGSNDFRRIVGVQVNSANVSVSNVHVENCFYGLRVHDSGNSIPTDVFLANIRTVNCNGSDPANGEPGMGISVTNACRRVVAHGLNAQGCDIGFSLAGRDGTYVGIVLSTNDIGLSTNDTLLQYNTLLAVQYIDNLVDTSAAYTPAASSMFPRSISATGLRQVFQNFVGFANDSAWTGDDAWLGGWKFIKADASGTPGEQIKAGAWATGASGTSFRFGIRFGGTGSPVFRVGATDTIVTTPTRYTAYDQAWDTFESSKNGDWSDEGVWIGGHRYLTADANAPQAEAVRAGVRATGTSGTAFGWGAAVNGALKFWVRADEVQAGATIRHMTDNAYSFGTASFRATAVYAVTGSIQTSDERQKQWRGTLTEAELRAGKRIIDEVGVYQWLDAIAQKGEDGARLHVGVRAQRVFAIMEEEGLEWQRYAWACYDSWEATPEETEPVTHFVEREEPRTVYEQTGEDEEGEPIFSPVEIMETVVVEEPTGEVAVVIPARAAGDAYGIRPDQLLFFLIAVQAALSASIEQRLAALEAA